MLVYRLEEETTRAGVYRVADVLNSWWRGRQNVMKRHLKIGRGWLNSHIDDRQPGPYSDGGLDKWTALSCENMDRYIFGFSSIRQMYHWFPRPMRMCMKLLARATDDYGNVTDAKPRRLIVAVYRVAKKWMVNGRQQCVFMKEKAKRVACLDLVTLKPI